MTQADKAADNVSPLKIIQYGGPALCYTRNS